MNTDELHIKDIYDIWYRPFWQQTWFVIAGIVLLLTLLSLVAYWFFSRRKKVTIPSPAERALTKLEVMLRGETHNPKIFYGKLTALLKEYLGKELALPLVGTTDDEMFEVLRSKQKLPDEIIASLKQIFEGVVLIKFANQQAVIERMKKAQRDAIQLVKQIARHTKQSE